MERIIARQRRPAAYLDALNILHWEMRLVLHQSVAMAIKIAKTRPIEKREGTGGNEALGGRRFQGSHNNQPNVCEFGGWYIGEGERQRRNVWVLHFVVVWGGELSG